MLTPNITELHRASAHPRPVTSLSAALAPATPAPDRRVAATPLAPRP